jgi:hypothetical protein
MLKFPKLHSGFATIDAQWENLLTIVQKYVEHHPVTNAAGVPLAKGDIVRATAGVRQAVLAVADNAQNSEWIGVLDGPPVVPVGVKTDMATSNFQLVRFEDGLVGLTEGVPCYLSDATPGAATPVDGAAFTVRIGIIVDASMYVSVTNHFALVLLGRCCTPTSPQ